MPMSQPLQIQVEQQFVIPLITQLHNELAMSAMQSLVECTVMLWGVNGAGLCILAGSRCEHKVGWL